MDWTHLVAAVVLSTGMEAPPPTPARFPAAHTGIGRIADISTADNGDVYLAATTAGLIFKVTPTGELSIVGGEALTQIGRTFAWWTVPGGPASASQIGRPVAVLATRRGLVLLDDEAHVFRLDEAARSVTVLWPRPAVSDSPPPGRVETLVQPTALALDRNGSLLIADPGAHRILRLNELTGDLFPVVGTGNGGTPREGQPAYSASLSAPTALAVNERHDIFILDRDLRRIYRIDGETGTVHSVADGFSDPVDLTWTGTDLLVADVGRRAVLRVDGSGAVSEAAQERFDAPTAVAVVPEGWLVADGGSRLVLRHSSGRWSTFAGDGGLGYANEGGDPRQACFKNVQDLELDAHGNLYVADAGGHRVQVVEAKTSQIRTVAGTGEAVGVSGEHAARRTAIPSPRSVAVDGKGDLTLLLGEDRLAMVSPSGTLRDPEGDPLRERISEVAVAGSATYVATHRGRILRLKKSGAVDRCVRGCPPASPGSAPDQRERVALASSPGKDLCYAVSDEYAGTFTVECLGKGRLGKGRPPTRGVVTRLAWDGARFYAVTLRHGILSISPDTGEATTVAGDGDRPPEDGASARAVRVLATGLAARAGRVVMTNGVVVYELQKDGLLRRITGGGDGY